MSLVTCSLYNSSLEPPKAGSWAFPVHCCHWTYLCKYDAEFDSYADDTQLYISKPISSPPPTSVSDCLQETNHSSPPTLRNIMTIKEKFTLLVRTQTSQLLHGHWHLSSSPTTLNPLDIPCYFHLLNINWLHSSLTLYILIRSLVHKIRIQKYNLSNHVWNSLMFKKKKTLKTTA